MKEFGNRLRQARQALGYTQQWMADQLKIDRSTYTKYETANVQPDLENLYYIGRLLKISLEELIKPD